MLNIKHKTTTGAAIAAILISLNGCSSSSSTSAAILSIINHDGTANVTLDGSYSSACYSSGGNFFIDSISVTGKTWTNTSKEHSDAACQTLTKTSVVTATAVTGTDGTSSGWVDGAGTATAAPTADDNTGTLDATPQFTPLALTITVAGTGDFSTLGVGDTADIFYVVDDTLGQTLYRDKSFTPGTDTRVGVADPLSNL